VYNLITRALSRVPQEGIADAAVSNASAMAPIRRVRP
jgi:hypothetical protein